MSQTHASGHMKTGASEWGGKAGWRKGRRQEPQTQSDARHGPSRPGAGESRAAALTGQHSRPAVPAEAILWPEWLVPTAAKPSDRGEDGAPWYGSWTPQTVQSSWQPLVTRRQCQELTGPEPHCSPHPTMGVVPWNWGNRVTNGMYTSSGSMGHFPQPRQREHQTEAGNCNSCSKQSIKLLIRNKD